MIVVTTPDVAISIISQYNHIATSVKVFNLCANVEWGDQLSLLPVQVYDPTNIEMWIDITFNQDNNYFMDIFKIINAAALGFTVFLLVYRTEVFDAAIEGVCDYIRDRYGYNYQWIENVDDFNLYDKSNFNYSGTLNYTNDYNRYSEILINEYPDLLTEYCGGD